MAQTINDVRGRINSVLCRTPFSFTPSPDPDTFADIPTTQIDQAFRVTTRSLRRMGGISFTSVNVDAVDIYVARKIAADQEAAKQQAFTDVTSIVAAVTRDGEQHGGDYAVEDGVTWDVTPQTGAEYAVTRITLPVNYEAQL